MGAGHRQQRRACMLGMILPLLLPLAAPAQAQGNAPLSVIDWLDAPAPLAQLPRAPANTPAPRPPLPPEPAVAQTGTAPQITVRPLGAGLPRAVGIVPAAVTGIRPDLWARSDPAQIARQLAALPDLDLPAANALLYTLLLAETAAPDGDQSAQDILTLARAGKLMQLGAVDPALALIEQAGAATSRSLFDLWAQLTLLVGTEDSSCAALAPAPYLTQDTGLRIFCAARAGDWDLAALTFGSASALSLLPRTTQNALDRFLNPDFFEDAPPLPIPRTTDPLTFRLFETIGEPLPTGPLPRPYAVADLRDIAGWKSQIEAAERLTRAGALPDNRLLGLYTERKPAASGGIWDRVRAVQRFDDALSARDAEAVARTLPLAWREMHGAGLEVSFATVFHERLAALTFSGETAVIAAQIGLLSPEYETVARALREDVSLGPNTGLLRAIATGEAASDAPQEALPRAIHDAFSSPASRAEWTEMARSQRLGAALVAILSRLQEGASGDSLALREALSGLRAFGLEDTARRASLQILLLDRTP